MRAVPPTSTLVGTLSGLAWPQPGEGRPCDAPPLGLLELTEAPPLVVRALLLVVPPVVVRALPDMPPLPPVSARPLVAVFLLSSPERPPEFDVVSRWIVSVAELPLAADDRRLPSVIPPELESVLLDWGVSSPEPPVAVLVDVGSPALELGEVVSELQPITNTPSSIP